jgi:hypothetical protein
MVTVLEVAGLPVAHGVASEVSTQVIVLPFNGTYEYVGKLVPTLLPFTFHW